MEINISFLGKQHQLKIDRAHYIRRLGYPKDYEVPVEIEESMQWAVQWYKEHGNPWLQIYELDVALKNDALLLNTFQTQAQKVYKRFQKYDVKKAMLLASTAGDSVDEKTTALWSSDYPDRAFFLDIFAASVTEAIVSLAVAHIKEWTSQKNMNTLSRYSPGYPGWDLKEQFLLMDVIKELSKDSIPITISDTALLSPLKSQLSLIGIYHGDAREKHVEIECAQCSFMDCGCKEKGMFVKI